MITPFKSVLKDLKTFFLGLFFAFAFLNPTPVFAVDPPATQQAQTQQNQQAQTQQNQQTQTQQNQSTQATQPATDATEEDEEDAESKKDVCRTESGGVGWIVCPTTGFLAKITDGIYGAIEDFLVVQPLAFDSDSPYHQVWSLFRDLTNVVFVIFLLIVIFSQLTGVGISNYGIKRALPKVIVAAILINLSYILCALLIDVSNILGASLRGFFTAIETSITPTGLLAEATSDYEINYVSLVGYLTGATLLGGLSIAMAGGLGTLFLSLIPVLLAAVVAIIIAYVTIAARQAFIFILIMVSPLAFVAMILPNTEKWYSSWKKSLTQMLIFYPVFSFLFGACSLIGWVVIASAETYLFMVLGMAIKIVPLFTSWSLFKMSGTLPGQVSASLSRFTRAPLAAASRPLSEIAALRRAKYLAENPRTYQNFRRFAQNMEDHRNRRFLDTADYTRSIKDRGLGYASEITNPEGRITRRGASLYGLVGNALETQTKVKRKENIMEQGIEDRAPSQRLRRRYSQEDSRVLHAADSSWMESTHGEWIKANNAISRRERMSRAMEAHDQSSLYNRRVDPAALSRYNQMSAVTDGDRVAARYLAASASSTANTQERLISNQFQQYFASLPPTQHVEDALKDITNQNQSAKYIEPIIAGLRVLNQRGDTDLLKKHLDDALSGGQIRLGTHASQSLANFLMFETKDSDFTLRRFGKYINLETARVFNEGQTPDEFHADGRRKNTAVDFKEYVTGHYIDYDDSGAAYIANSKLAMPALLKGTPINNVERTAFKNFDESLKAAYGDDLEGLKQARSESISSLMPAIISAGLSYPSGSEQLVNLASWLTGLKEKNGQWVKTWEDPSSPLYGFSGEDIAENAKNYVRAQTATQFYSMRTDILTPLTALLALSYEHNPAAIRAIDPDTPERIQNLKSSLDNLREEELAATTPEEKSDLAKRIKKAEKALRDEQGSAVFLDILDDNNVLLQMVNTRRSGGANNSKTAIRRLLHIDEDRWSENYKRKKLQEIEQRRRQNLTENAPPDPDSPPPASQDNPVYDSNTRRYFIDQINAINDAADGDTNAFYADTMDYLRSVLGASSYIVKSIEREVRENGNVVPSSILHTIISILSDPDNY